MAPSPKTPPPTQKKNQATTSDTSSRGRARPSSVSTPGSARSRSVGGSAHLDYYAPLARRRTKGRRPAYDQLKLPTFVLHPEPESNSEDDVDIHIAVQAASPIVDSYPLFSTLDPSRFFSSSSSSMIPLLSASVYGTRSIISVVSPATTAEAVPSYELNKSDTAKLLIQAQAPGAISRSASTSALDSLKSFKGSTKRHNISMATWGIKGGLPALFGSNTALDTRPASPEQMATSTGAETQSTKRPRVGGFVGLDSVSHSRGAPGPRSSPQITSTAEPSPETPPPTQKENQATTSDTSSRGRARSSSASTFAQAPNSERSRRSVGRSAHADYYNPLTQRMSQRRRPTLPPPVPPMQLELPTFVLHPEPEPESNSEDDGKILIAVQAENDGNIQIAIEAASLGEYPASTLVDSSLSFRSFGPSSSPFISAVSPKPESRLEDDDDIQVATEATSPGEHPPSSLYPPFGSLDSPSSSYIPIAPPKPESQPEDDDAIQVATEAASPREYPPSPAGDPYLPFRSLDPSSASFIPIVSPKPESKPEGDGDIQIPIKAASPGEYSALPLTEPHPSPSLVINMPFHYTFPTYSYDNSTRHNNLDFSLDKTIDNGVYLSRISRSSEGLLPSLSTILETKKDTISDSPKSLLTHSEDLYQALQVAHDIVWRLSQQLADILHEDDPLSHLDKFLAELAEVFRVQGIRILSEIGDLYFAFLDDSETLHRLEHKAISEVVVEYMAWQDNMAALLMAVQVEEHRLGTGKGQIQQAPFEKEDYHPSLSAIQDRKEEGQSLHTHSQDLRQSLRAANHTIWKLSRALVDISCRSDPLSGLDKLSVNFAEAIKVEGSRILNSINNLYLALSFGKTSLHLRWEFLIKMFEEYKAWQENVNALIEAIGDEGGRLATCRVPEVVGTDEQPGIQGLSPLGIAGDYGCSRDPLQVLQSANLFMRKLLGEIAEVMEKDGPLGDLDTLLTRSADSIKVEGIRIVSSVTNLFLASRPVADGRNSRDVLYEVLTEVVPKLMVWKGHVMTLLNEFGTERNRLNGLGKLDFKEQVQGFPAHAEDHAKAFHHALQVAKETIWELSQQLSSTYNSRELERLSKNFAASVKVEGICILTSINALYLTLAGDGEISYCLRLQVLTKAVEEYMTWQDDMIISLDAVAIQSSNVHEDREAAVEEQVESSPRCGMYAAGGDGGSPAGPRCQRRNRSNL